MYYNIDDLIANFQNFKNNGDNYHILSHISEDDGNPDYKYLEMDLNLGERKEYEEHEENQQIVYTGSNMPHVQYDHYREHNIIKMIMPYVSNIATGYDIIDEKILEQLTDRIIFSCIDHIDGMEDIYLELDRSPYSRYHLLRELINALVHTVNK